MQAKRHAEQTRDLTTFAVNMARLTLSEWMRVGIRSTIPAIEAELQTIQDELHCDRAKAIEVYVDRQMTSSDEERS